MVRRFDEDALLKKSFEKEQGRSTLEDVKPFISRSAFLSLSEPSDALAFYDQTGFYLRLQPSDSAAVQPWNLIISLVSLDEGVVRTAYRSTETGSRLEDSKGFRVTDVLPHDVQTPLDRMALAYAFTRIPYLSIPGQLSAAVVISWARCIEQAFRTVFDEVISKTPHDKDYVKQMVVQAHKMLPRVRMLATKMDEVKKALAIVEASYISCFSCLVVLLGGLVVLCVSLSCSLFLLCLLCCFCYLLGFLLFISCWSFCSLFL